MSTYADIHNVSTYADTAHMPAFDETAGLTANDGSLHQLDAGEEQCAICGQARGADQFTDGLRCLHCAETGEHDEQPE